MDWDETDDHDFSDSEVDYYMGKEPRKTGGSKQHIHQQRQPERVTPCDDCEYYGSCSERPFNKSRGCRLRYAEAE